LRFPTKKPQGIFLNPVKTNCSIYESGKMFYESLLLSNRYELDYLEIRESLCHVSSKYDFYVFNYHHITMGWLDTKSIRRLPGVKITFVLETLINNPFVLCPSDDFDAYCALDPTMNVADKRVYAFPRPLEIRKALTLYHEPAIPVIGSFGFATPGKGFELVVDAVNKEFDEAIIKLNIPSGTYVDGSWKLHKQNYADYLGELCKKIAKKGVQVIVTNEYMTKDDLIEWCSMNTLNCFLYNRNQPGLSATTDQAISSGRPLAISTNETFRHIHPYLKPYPFQTLRESIVLSKTQVLQMQKDWSSKNFAARFEEVLQDFNLFLNTKRKHLQTHMIQLREKRYNRKPLVRTIKKFEKLLKPLIVLKQTQQKQLPIKIAEQPQNTILIVSHKEKQCGIYQYGVNIAEALQKSSRYSFLYTECSSYEELHQTVVKTTPAAIIYNYYPETMPWLKSSVTRQYTVSNLGIMHEVTQEEADKATQELFDYRLCPDPTLVENNPFVSRTQRLIPPYLNIKNIPDIATIGSFGFGFNDKGFERLLNVVQQEFEQAKISLHLPFNDIVDKQGRTHALATAKRCRNIISKPGIQLVINHKFLSKQQLLDWLASNTINAFFYDTHKNRGISSVIEHALAVQRPIAITRCGMFRHMFSSSPSVCIEDSSLGSIIKNGIVPLVPFYNEWSEANFILNYECILDRILSQKQLSSSALVL